MPITPGRSAAATQQLTALNINEEKWLKQQFKFYGLKLMQVDQAPTILPATNRTRTNGQFNNEVISFSQDFLLSANKLPLSDSTLPEPLNKHLSENANSNDQQEQHPSLFQVLSNLPKENQLQSDTESVDNYWRWKSLLMNGFSVLLHGHGSKLQILDSFQKNFLADGICCVIYGYKKFDFKSIMQALLNYVCPLKPEKINQTHLLMKHLIANLKLAVTPVYLVVHNIEAPSLHSKQRELAILASIPSVHLICSVDHIRSELLWDSVDLHDFNFIYEHCSSMNDYREEVLQLWSDGPPAWLVFDCLENEHKSVRLDIILAALTKNHKRLVKIIAEEQLRDAKSLGLPEELLFHDSRASVIGIDRQKLNKLLVELTSHQIVERRINSEGKMALFILANRKQLEKLIMED